MMSLSSDIENMETNELIDAQPCVFDDLDGLGGMTAPGGLVYDPELEAA